MLRDAARLDSFSRKREKECRVQPANICSAYFLLNAACAAASRAIGTRNAEQDT
jgi:hypothetical protein